MKEREYIGQESNSFLERFYDGDITAMLSAYLERADNCGIQSLLSALRLSVWFFDN